MNGIRPQAKTFVGTAFSLTGNKVTVKIRDGKKRTYRIADEATIIRDGMTSTLEEIHIGQNIRVTTRKKDFNIVSVIESLRNNAEFPSLIGARE